jgi:hypothetical protein
VMTMFFPVISLIPVSFQVSLRSPLPGARSGLAAVSCIATLSLIWILARSRSQSNVLTIAGRSDPGRASWFFRYHMPRAVATLPLPETRLELGFYAAVIVR